MKYAKAQGYKSAATLHDGSLYAEELANAFEREVEGRRRHHRRRRGRHALRHRPAPGADPHRHRQAAICCSRPVFVGVSAYLARQIKEVPTMAKVPLLGTDAVLSPAFLEAAGDAAKSATA